MSVAEKDEGDEREQRKKGCRHYGRLAGHGRALSKRIAIAITRGCDGTVDQTDEGDQILAVPGDITDRRTASVRFRKAWPGSDASIHSSTMPACSLPKHSRSIPRLITRLVLGVNLTGFFHITQLAIAEMEKRQSVTSCKSRRA